MMCAYALWVNVEFLLQGRRVVGQAEAELPGALVGEKAVQEVMSADAISFRMIRTPWSRVVWRPCLLRGTRRSRLTRQPRASWPSCLRAVSQADPLRNAGPTARVGPLAPLGPDQGTTWARRNCG